jgi:hypothetical protein
MDVVAAPPAEQKPAKAEPADDDPIDKLAAQDQAEQAAQKSEKKTEPKPSKPKVTAHPGTNIAIVATVIIVLGLAALATYAYLQTAK